MSKKILQALGAFGAPLLTLACTVLAARFIDEDEPVKALGAALAGLVGFALTQVADELPKRLQWWRRRYDRRAAYEGWWLQVHDGRDRAAVYSFNYNGDDDTYEAYGNAFDSKGSHLAHWKSTQVFFSTGSRDTSYLWAGESLEAENGGYREGTTTLSLDRSARRRLPISGQGDVQHLNLARKFHFRIRRIEPSLLRGLGIAHAVEDLADFDRQRELASALLVKQEQMSRAEARPTFSGTS